MVSKARRKSLPLWSFGSGEEENTEKGKIERMLESENCYGEK